MLLATLAMMAAVVATATSPSYRYNLAPAPSPFATHQAFYNASSWSWGAGIIHVSEDTANPFHMFAEAEVGNGTPAGACGVHAWQTNARVVHAVSKLAEGPYVYSDTPIPNVWRSGPDITRAADGTFLLWTMASNATAARCVGGVGIYNCSVDPATGEKPPPGYPCVHNGVFRNRLYSSASVYGPWTEVRRCTSISPKTDWLGRCDAIPASINANTVAHQLPNGTSIVMGGGLYIAAHWRGPYTKQSRSINLVYPGGISAKDYWANCPKDHRNVAYSRWPEAVCALEDIFFWFDVGRHRWRWMAHQKLKGAGSRGLHQCNYFPGVGGFAQSETDDFWSPWNYDFWAPAYGLNAKLSNSSEYCLTSRERPKMFMIGNRSFLTNSACPTTMGPGDSRCFTMLQEVLSENTISSE